MIDICHTTPTGQEIRIRRVSPAQTKRAAEAHERQLRQELVGLSPGTEEPEEHQTTTIAPTVADFGDRFVTDHCLVEQHRPSSVRSVRTILSNHIVPAVGSVRIDAIRSKHFGEVKRSMARRRARVKPKTVNNALAVLSRMVRFWYECADQTPPRIDAGLLRVDEPEVECYHPEEYERLVTGAATVGPQEHALVLVMGDAGLRQGEARALRWADLDLGASPTVRVRRSRDLETEHAPKGKRGRTVPLTDRLAHALKDVPRRRGKEHVFLNDGEPLTAKAVKVRILRAERAAGLPETGLSHKLRHTFATRLDASNVSPWVIKELLGHRDLATTQRYLHSIHGASTEAIRRLGMTTNRQTQTPHGTIAAPPKGVN